MSNVNKTDLIGLTFGELTAIEYSHTDKNYRSYWLCRCSCGKEKIILRHSLMSGRSKSCGHTIKYNSTKHNSSYKRLYNIWRCMKQRCNNKNNTNYYNYGGRGISTCNDWSKSFKTFEEWAINNGYKDTLTIDRINTNGNYEPNNCKWSTRKEQANNKRYTKNKNTIIYNPKYYPSELEV